MASQEHPLLSLEPAKQQQLVDLVESNDIDALATKTGLTRRQILGIGATLAGSGALGAYAATEAIDPAQAQADTGDSDGNVGLPDDRVDVFADGIDTNSLSTGQIVSGSLPKIRIYKDGSETVAVDESGELGRDTDPSVTWQAAFDEAKSRYDNTSTPYVPAVVIDGGHQRYTLPSKVVHKEGAYLQNVQFDGSNIGTGFTYQVGSTTDTSTNKGFGAENVAVIGSGDDGIQLMDVTGARFSNVICTGATDRGWEVQSSLLNTFVNCRSRDNGGRGLLSQGSGESGAACNSNVFLGWRSMNNGNAGVEWQNGSGTTFLNSAFEQNSNAGLKATQSGPVHILTPWFEGNGATNNISGDNSVLAWPRTQEGNLSTVFAFYSSRQAFYGPWFNGGGGSYDKSSATSLQEIALDTNKSV